MSSKVLQSCLDDDDDDVDYMMALQNGVALHCSLQGHEVMCNLESKGRSKGQHRLSTELYANWPTSSSLCYDEGECQFLSFKEI